MSHLQLPSTRCLMRRWRVLSGLHWCRIGRPDKASSRRIRQVVKSGLKHRRNTLRPRPIHIVARPNWASLRSIRFSSVVLIRAPEQLQRMTQRDRATVEVDLLVNLLNQSQILIHGKVICAQRLHSFPKHADITDRKPCFFQCQLEAGTGLRNSIITGHNQRPPSNARGRAA